VDRAQKTAAAPPKRDGRESRSQVVVDGSAGAPGLQPLDYIPLKSGLRPSMKEPMPSLAAGVQATSPEAR
jgi:hypothetical protein